MVIRALAFASIATVLACGGSTSAGNAMPADRGDAAGSATDPAAPDGAPKTCDVPASFTCHDRCGGTKTGAPVCSEGFWSCPAEAPESSTWCCAPDHPMKCCDNRGASTPPTCGQLDSAYYSCPEGAVLIPDQLECKPFEEFFPCSDYAPKSFCRRDTEVCVSTMRFQGCVAMANACMGTKPFDCECLPKDGISAVCKPTERPSCSRSNAGGASLVCAAFGL